MLIYYIDTGIILRKIEPDEMIDAYKKHYEKDSNIGIIPEYFNLDIRVNYIVDGEPVLMTDSEIEEVSMFGRFLTEEERLLNKLKPPMDEVREAEQTIKILELIEEVI